MTQVTASLLNQMMWYKGIFITEIYSKSSDYWLHAVCKQVLTARGISCCCSLLRPAFGIISCPVFLCDFVLRRITPPWVSPPAKSIYHYHCKGKLKVYFTSLLKVDSTSSHYMMVADGCFSSIHQEMPRWKVTGNVLEQYGGIHWYSSLHAKHANQGWSEMADFDIDGRSLMHRLNSCCLWSILSCHFL